MMQRKGATWTRSFPLDRSPGELGKSAELCDHSETAEPAGWVADGIGARATRNWGGGGLGQHGQAGKQTIEGAGLSAPPGTGKLRGDVERKTSIANSDTVSLINMRRGVQTASSSSLPE